jgi:hypothetical protein
MCVKEESNESSKRKEKQITQSSRNCHINHTKKKFIEYKSKRRVEEDTPCTILLSLSLPLTLTNNLRTSTT